MKNTLQKRLCGIFAVCFLMGILSLSAFAAGIINIINLTVDAPKAGKIPAATASLPEKPAPGC